MHGNINYSIPSTSSLIISDLDSDYNEEEINPTFELQPWELEVLDYLKNQATNAIGFICDPDNKLKGSKLSSYLNKLSGGIAVKYDVHLRHKVFKKCLKVFDTMSVFVLVKMDTSTALNLYAELLKQVKSMPNVKLIVLCQHSDDFVVQRFKKDAFHLDMFKVVDNNMQNVNNVPVSNIDVKVDTNMLKFICDNAEYFVNAFDCLSNMNY